MRDIDPKCVKNLTATLPPHTPPTHTLLPLSPLALLFVLWAMSGRNKIETRNFYHGFDLLLGITKNEMNLNYSISVYIKTTK